MRAPALALALLALPVACGSSDSGGSGSAGDAEAADVTGITAAHNAARAAVDPAASPALDPLVYSADLAAVAQATAAKCQFQHSGNQYGENIYASTGASTPENVVDSWVAEKKSYDYASNACADVCGHYTQVVWRDSKKLGCAVQDCTTNSPFSTPNWQLWVCNYDPPGNYVGDKPY